MMFRRLHMFFSLRIVEEGSAPDGRLRSLLLFLRARKKREFHIGKN